MQTTPSSTRKAPQSRGVSASLRRLALRRAASVLAVSTLLALPLASQAAPYNWDPGQTGTAAGGGSGMWDTTTPNWYNGTADVVWPNTVANTSVFGGTAGTVGLGSNITTGGLTFNTAGYTIATGANTLSIGIGGITTADGGTGTTTITGTVASVGTQAWNVGAGDTLQFNAAFSSPTATNSLQINSAGTTNITNTFSVAGKSTLTGGGIFNLSGTETFETSASDYAGISNATVNNTAGTTTFTPGTANSLFIGNTGSATQSSTLNITGGSVVVGNGTRIFIGDSFNGTVTTAGDGTLNVGGGTGTGTFSTGTTTNATAITLGNNASTGTVNLLANGVISTNRNFAAGAANKGLFNFNGGTFQSTGTAAGIAASVVTTIAEGGAFVAPGANAINLATSIGHGGTAAIDGGLTVVAGTGNITLSGNNTYTGVTNVNAFINASNANAFGAAASGTNINTGGTVRYRDQNNSTLAEAFTLNGGGFQAYNDIGTTTLSGGFALNQNSTLEFQPQAQKNTTFNITGAITDGGTGRNLTLTRDGNAGAASNDNVNLSAVNTYGGNTTISDQLTANTGTFSVNLVGGDNRLPITTAVTLTNAQLTLGSGTGASNQTLTGSTGTGTKIAVVGGSTATSTLTLNVTGTDTYAGNLGGAGTNQNNLALAVSGPGTVTLTGANSYSGGTIVNSGTLSLGATAADGTGALTVNKGGTTTVTANNALGGGNVTLAGGTLQNGNTSGTNATNMQTSGVLALATGTASTLDFGAGNAGAVFTFTGFDAANTGTLSIINYLGTPNAGLGLDQLFVAGTPLTAAQLGQFSFLTGGQTFGATQLASGEIVENAPAAAPEPSQYAAFAVGLLGLGALALKARKRTLSA